MNKQLENAVFRLRAGGLLDNDLMPQCSEFLEGWGFAMPIEAQPAKARKPARMPEFCPIVTGH